jgi:hypothetical protein
MRQSKTDILFLKVLRGLNISYKILLKKKYEYSKQSYNSEQIVKSEI